MNRSLKILLLLLYISISGRALGQVDTIVWTQLSPLPDSIQRIGFGYFLIDSNFYVIGGQNGNTSSSISLVWEYHISSDSWTQMRNLPFGGASCAASFVINGKGYFLTARDSVSNDNCDTTFWEYDPAGDNWSIRAGFPDAPRQGSSFFRYDGKGYVGQTFGCSAVDSHFWSYDPLVDMWSQVSAIPANISAGSAAVALLSSDSEYLIGGINSSANYVGDIWQYNIGGNQWDSVGQMPGSAREGAIFWGFDNLLIGGGGVSDSMDIDYYSYNVCQKSWAPVVFQNSFDSTVGGATFIYNTRAYYFGGISSYNQFKFSNNLWSFDASRFFPPDSGTGIASVKSDISFSLYPNPVHPGQGISVSTSESGTIVFYDALGRQVDERRLRHGLNQIRLTATDEVLFYKATLSSGAVENGKVVMVN